MRSAPTSTTAATPPRCVRRVVYVANSHPSQPLRHAQIKQREVTVLRNLPIPCSNPRLWIPNCHFFCFCSAAAALRTPGNFMAFGLRL